MKRRGDSSFGRKSAANHGSARTRAREALEEVPDSSLTRRPPREVGFSRDADKLIRRLSLIAFLLSRQGQPVETAEIRRRVEGYSLMTDLAFKRRFYEDRHDLAALGIEITRIQDDTTGIEAYALHPDRYHLPPIALTDGELSALTACLFVLQDRFAFSQPTSPSSKMPWRKARQSRSPTTQSSAMRLCHARSIPTA